MTWAPYVTRTELGLGNLSLNDSSYKMDHPEEGWLESIQWEKHTVRSPFYHGEFLVNAVKKQTSVTPRILVFGSSISDVHTKVNTLLATFAQFSYDLAYAKDTTEYTFSCQPADYLVDYRWLMYEEAIYTMPVSFVCPVSPIYAIT